MAQRLLSGGEFRFGPGEYSPGAVDKAAAGRQHNCSPDRYAIAIAHAYDRGDTAALARPDRAAFPVPVAHTQSRYLVQ